MTSPGDEPTMIRLALAQVNPTVGAIEANAELVLDRIGAARDAGADLVVLPELVITGYPPEDLLLKRHFVASATEAIDRLAADVVGITALVGGVLEADGLRNALHVIGDGRRLASYAKVLLPNYGVFDERRYFEPGDRGALLGLGDALIGLTVCEDVWVPGPPDADEAAAGASLIVNASASPYHRGKGAERERMLSERARQNGVPMALCNMVGGQDELVFDGHSVVVDGEGRTLARAAQFEPELLLCDLELSAPRAVAERGAIPEIASVASAEAPGGGPARDRLAPPLSDREEVYRSLALGLRDYLSKNGFTHAVLGLSGGIDSALVAMLAADAIGGERTSCVIMPSPHSSEETQADARAIAANLGCEAFEIRIEEVMEAYEGSLAEPFAETEAGIAEENLQARIRGNIVMALSNKFGWLPLTTGNKSEMSVGYTTLYGDMAGGFAVIKDVPKTLVYELVRFRNEEADTELVPASVIDRPPTAELRPGQLDTDSLPPYDVLDRALEEYVERDGSRETMIAAGIDPALADRVIRLVDGSEYKRRQAPPGVKITPKAFGRDRRLPITNRFGG